MKDKCRYPKKKIIYWLVHGLAVLVIRSAIFVHSKKFYTGIIKNYKNIFKQLSVFIFNTVLIKSLQTDLIF